MKYPLEGHNLALVGILPSGTPWWIPVAAFVLATIWLVVVVRRNNPK
jgi:hypothetical membrane protein